MGDCANVMDEELGGGFVHFVNERCLERAADWFVRYLEVCCRPPGKMEFAVQAFIYSFDNERRV